MTIEDEIRALAEKYAAALTAKITERLEEMTSDDKSRYLVYGVLGIDLKTILEKLFGEKST